MSQGLVYAMLVEAQENERARNRARFTPRRTRRAARDYIISRRLV